MIFNKPLSSSQLLRYGIWTEIANCSRMLMELITILVWYCALTHSISAWGINFLILGLVFFSSHFLARYLNQTSLKPLFQRLLYSGWILLALYFSLKVLLFRGEPLGFLDIFQKTINLISDEYSLDSFWHLTLTLLLILRSVLITRFPISTGDALTSFRNCLIFFILHAFIFARHMPQLTFVFFFSYVLFGLISLSTARIADLGDLQGGRIPAFNRNWAAGILGASSLGLFASLIAGTIFNVKAAELLSTALVSIIQIITGLIVLLFSPILLGILYIFEIIIKLLGPLLSQANEAAEMDLGYSATDIFSEQIDQVSNFDPRAILLGSILLGLILLVIISLHWKPWQRNIEGEEDNSFMEPEKKATNPLKNLLENLGNLIKPPKANRLLAAAQIRRIYAGLMDLCRKMGHERPKAVTPLEFLPQLEIIFPENRDDLKTITNAYLQIRYGELPEQMEEVKIVKDAWENIKEYGNQALEEKKKQLKK